jgi:hypothetical protein
MSWIPVNGRVMSGGPRAKMWMVVPQGSVIAPGIGLRPVPI